MSKRKKPKVSPERNATPDEIHDRYARTIKGEILKRGLVNFRIAQETGISNAALSRFFKPGGTIKAESVFVLLDYLGIELFSAEEQRTLKPETYDELIRADIEGQIRDLRDKLD